MCGRSCRSQSLGRQRPHHWDLQVSPWKAQMVGDAGHCCSPDSRKLLERPGWGSQRTVASQGRGVSRSTIRKKKEHCSPCCRERGGKDEVPWEAEVPLYCVTSPYLLPHGHVRWMHSSWRNKAKQDEKGKRDVKRTPCIRNQKGNTLKANMMMEI